MWLDYYRVRQGNLFLFMVKFMYKFSSKTFNKTGSALSWQDVTAWTLLNRRQCIIAIFRVTTNNSETLDFCPDIIFWNDLPLDHSLFHLVKQQGYIFHFNDVWQELFEMITSYYHCLYGRFHTKVVLCVIKSSDSFAAYKQRINRRTRLILGTETRTGSDLQVTRKDGCTLRWDEVRRRCWPRRRRCWTGRCSWWRWTRWSGGCRTRTGSCARSIASSSKMRQNRFTSSGPNMRVATRARSASSRPRRHARLPPQQVVQQPWAICQVATSRAPITHIVSSVAYHTFFSGMSAGRTARRIWSKCFRSNLLQKQVENCFQALGSPVNIISQQQVFVPRTRLSNKRNYSYYISENKYFNRQFDQCVPNWLYLVYFRIDHIPSLEASKVQINYLIIQPYRYQICILCTWIDIEYRHIY